MSPLERIREIARRYDNYRYESLDGFNIVLGALIAGGLILLTFMLQ